jgi:DNA repair exonuclease SbcCD nuclease subunit
MIKKIIFIADVHIRNYKRLDEYKIQLKKFIDDCTDIVNEYGSEHVRIVILGDLLHNKLDISGEGYIVASQFLKQLDRLCKTIIISGNHDMNMANLSRVDPISTIFNLCSFEQTHFLDKETEYESGCVVDENVTWALYSSFDGFAKPNIDEEKINHPKNITIGLFHGDIKNTKTDAGYVVENGFDASYFDELDICMCGHIHKRQTLTYRGIPIIYVGSLIQQDHGENINDHGYVVLDVETMEYTEHNIPNESGFYTFVINSIEDIDNNVEELINY